MAPVTAIMLTCDFGVTRTRYWVWVVLAVKVLVVSGIETVSEDGLATEP